MVVVSALSSPRCHLYVRLGLVSLFSSFFLWKRLGRSPPRLLSSFSTASSVMCGLLGRSTPDHQLQLQRRSRHNVSLFTVKCNVCLVDGLVELDLTGRAIKKRFLAFYLTFYLPSITKELHFSSVFIEQWLRSHCRSGCLVPVFCWGLIFFFLMVFRVAAPYMKNTLFVGLHVCGVGPICKLLYRRNSPLSTFLWTYCHLLGKLCVNSHSCEQREWIE